MRISSSVVPVADLLEDSPFNELYCLWDGLRDGRFAPAWQPASFIRLPGDVLPYLTVVDVRWDPEDFVYRLWGTGHTAVKGCDLTGRSVRQHYPAQAKEVFIDDYRRVVAARAPVGFRHDLCSTADRPSPYRRVLRLPLSADGEAVTQVVSVADWGHAEREWGRLFGHVGASSPILAEAPYRYARLSRESTAQANTSAARTRSGEAE